MQFQLREIILWPRATTLPPRRLLFEPGMVNVISGASRTGKSAIIPIIDYCLGADKCSIPVNVIRDHTAWFGILVETSNGKKLFARREPGSQKSTGDMFLLEGDFEIPSSISKNANVDAVKRTLDDLAGLTTLDFDPGGFGAGFQGRPSFRDMSAFTFQPQNIVANPDVFFYKADTYEHREKLRTIFPYVLGAIDPKLLAKQHEVAQLKKDLRRKQVERSNIEQVSARWVAEIRSRVSQARELGLIEAPIPPQATRTELIDLLTESIRRPAENSRLSVDMLTEALAELNQLRDEEAGLSREYNQLRRRLMQMDELRKATTDYRGALQIQRDRLQVSRWLGSASDANHDCPICGNSLSQEEEQVNRFLTSLSEMEKGVETLAVVPPAYDREYERVRVDVRLCLERLEAVKSRRRALERTSSEAQQQQIDSLSVSRFLGSSEQALDLYNSIGSDNDLSSEIQELEERISLLDAEISEQGVRGRTQRALQSVNANIARLLPQLDAERPNDPVQLLIQDLTVKIVGTDREDYLWEIGSGSNWLAYHVAASIALQQFFLSRSQSAVPSFVVYDQPSQVYFPRKLANRDSTPEDPRFTDEDLVAIRRLFLLLSQVTKEAAGKLQALVLDHADAEVWGNIPEVHLVEEWREGPKLIPNEWIT